MITTTKTPMCICFQTLYEDKKANIADFGKVTEIYADGRSRPSVYDSENISDEIVHYLDKLDYQPARDYLVIASGNLSGIAHLIAVATSLYGKVKALFFDPARKIYVSVELGLDIEEEEHATTQTA